MAIGDKIVVKSLGVGMDLTDHPDVKVKSCSPEMLDGLEVVTGVDGKLHVPVTAVVPPHLLGAGAEPDQRGQFLHIQSQETSRHSRRRVLMARRCRGAAGTSTAAGTTVTSAALSIGVVRRGDSRARYGPGITVLMTSAAGGIAPVVTPGVNLKDVFALA
ncbi:MAG: DUF4438 domain-containing protein [Anaerolineae bacterium]